MSNCVLVAVKYTVKPGKRDEFYKKVAGEGIIEESKAEAGNLKYEISASLDSQDVLCLLEIWDSTESQMLHGQTLHYQKLQALKNEYVTNVAIEKYLISERI